VARETADPITRDTLPEIADAYERLAARSVTLLTVSRVYDQCQHRQARRAASQGGEGWLVRTIPRLSLSGKRGPHAYKGGAPASGHEGPRGILCAFTKLRMHSSR
jgi:hypothetical protein